VLLKAAPLFKTISVAVLLVSSGRLLRTVISRKGKSRREMVVQLASFCGYLMDVVRTKVIKGSNDVQSCYLS
jgi:hypothetical protein